MWSSRVLLPAVALAACAQAAVIRGTVVENQTGKFLARATVAVQPVAGTPGAAVSVKTSVTGLFEFGALAPGSYVVKVTRLGFMPLEYGQKRWNSAGTPLKVDDSAPAFLAMRLYRWSAIAGAVVDENDIGLPEHDVVVYRNTRPPQQVVRAKSDERGMYRISGLEPGTYLVRTAGAQYEEGAYLPTFGSESVRVENARMVDVEVDQQANEVNVRPVLGRLVSISGSVITDPPFTPTRVTLATDIGRQTTTTVEAFRFTGVTPGPYEIYAEAPADGDASVKFQGAYVSSTLRDDETKVGMTLTNKSNVSIEIRGGPRVSEVRVEARRKDLAGEGEIVRVKDPGRAQLGPGRWEVRLTPPEGYYVSAFYGRSSYRAGRTRPDGWNETLVDGYGGPLRFTLTAGGGSLTGVVKNGADAAAGAPVYLEAWDADARQRLVEMRTTRTDVRGGFRFRDLPPGLYRVMSTFEYRDPDSAAFDRANAVSMRIDANDEQKRDLELYVIQ